MTLSKSLASK